MHLDVKRAMRIVFGELGPVESVFNPEEAMPDPDAAPADEFTIPAPPADVIPAPLALGGKDPEPAPAVEEAPAAPVVEEAPAAPVAEEPAPPAEDDTKASAPAPAPVARPASVSELLTVVEGLNAGNIALAAKILERVGGHTVTIPDNATPLRLSDRVAKMIADGNGLASILLALDAAI